MLLLCNMCVHEREREGEEGGRGERDDILFVVLVLCLVKHVVKFELNVLILCRSV